MYSDGMLPSPGMYHIRKWLCLQGKGWGCGVETHPSKKCFSHTQAFPGYPRQEITHYWKITREPRIEVEERTEFSKLVLSSVLSYCRHFVPTAVLMLWLFLDSRVLALPGCSLTLAHSPRRSSLRPYGKNWAALPSKLDPVSVCSCEQERLLCHLFWKTCPALLNGGRKFRKCALCPGHP